MLACMKCSLYDSFLVSLLARLNCKVLPVTCVSLEIHKATMVWRGNTVLTSPQTNNMSLGEEKPS